MISEEGIKYFDNLARFCPNLKVNEFILQIKDDFQLDFTTSPTNFAAYK